MMRWLVTAVVTYAAVSMLRSAQLTAQPMRASTR
jgi:hypothetical protein